MLDAPTLTASKVGTKLVLCWGTNWTSYSLYSASSLSRGNVEQGNDYPG